MKIMESQRERQTVKGAASSSCLGATGHGLRQCMWCWLGGGGEKLQLKEGNFLGAHVQKTQS